MAKLHALFMGKLAWLKDQPWLDHAHSRGVAIKLRPLWKAMLANATREFPMIWTNKVLVNHLCVVLRCFSLIEHV